MAFKQYELNGKAMTDEVISVNEGGINKTQYWSIILFMVTILLSIYIFSDGLERMLIDWEREEFSHGYIIPLISLYLLLQKFPQLLNASFNRFQSVGVCIVFVGIVLNFLGELSSLFNIIQYGFLVTLFGITVAFLGVRGAMVIAVPLAYLLFMIPLPAFLYFNLSQKLQLLSSGLGVSILRLLNVSVFLEGNVIDLGIFKLQVVDACSGLRYLFPLMSFGFLVAYIYRASHWKKITIFLSTIPITIFMNSFRIAVIGLTVDIWGIAAAEGFLHDFEGWVVFMACLVLLAVEVWSLERIAGTKDGVLTKLNINLPKEFCIERILDKTKKIRFPSLFVLIFLLLCIPMKLMLSDRSEIIPSRHKFITLPLVLDNWVGREGRLDHDISDALKVNDYIVADYVNSRSGYHVNFYSAYYESQRKGASVHSPKTCMPGGGWEIQKMEEVSLPNIFPYIGKPLRVNRAIIQNQGSKNLVYFWFQQRGRVITNEYLLKWYLFQDSLFRNRSDGALVRYVVDISHDTDIEKTEIQLQEFVATTAPLLPAYIPE